MINKRVQALFDFIDYLNLNKDFFKSKVVEFKKLEQLKVERDNFNPDKTFKERIEYNKLDKILKETFDKLNEDVITPFFAKVNDTNICDYNKLETLYNWNISEINDLKVNFTDNDIPVILEYKEKYLNFRRETNYHFFHSFFFNDLDEILKILFDFFKETQINEFESFETKTIKADDLNELVNFLQIGRSKVSIGRTEPVNTNNRKLDLYQISDIKSIMLTENGEIHKTGELESDFVLRNKNIYSEKGDIVKEALNPSDYDMNFYLRLKHINPIYLINDFLDYHYNNTSNKDKFLLHIEYKILSDYFKQDKDNKRIDFITKWIDTQKKRIAPIKYKEWISLSIEEKYLCAFESYKKKFNNDDEYSFIEMESEFLSKEITKYENATKLEPEQLKILIEFRKLLKYLNSKNELKNQQIKLVTGKDLTISETYKFIDNTFNNQITKFFKSTDDYELFKTVITQYFESKGEIVNPLKLELNKRTRTPLYGLIHQILDKYQFKNTPKNQHTGLYQICKGLSVYQDVKESDFFKRLSSD
jgi:hypothetical protein